jgi:DNA-binding NarL/FixJ family response regulator
MRKIKVLIADDHALVRRELKKILRDEASIEIVGEADNGRAAVQLAAQLNPDVVLMDVAMPELNGIEATRQITQELPQTKILALSLHDNETYVRHMTQAGAKGYLLKNTIESELIKAIQAVHHGNPYLNPRISRITIEKHQEH